MTHCKNCGFAIYFDPTKNTYYHFPSFPNTNGYAWINPCTKPKPCHSPKQSSWEE